MEVKIRQISGHRPCKYARPGADRSTKIYSEVIDFLEGLDKLPDRSLVARRNKETL
jgi:hypothetical protein